MGIIKKIKEVLSYSGKIVESMVSQAINQAYLARRIDVFANYIDKNVYKKLGKNKPLTEFDHRMISYYISLVDFKPLSLDAGKNEENIERIKHGLYFTQAEVALAHVLQPENEPQDTAYDGIPKPEFKFVGSNSQNFTINYNDNESFSIEYNAEEGLEK